MEITSTLGLEVSILLFAALLGYILAVRIGQSAVIGIILIGIFIGPSILGLVSYNEIVRILAELGAIFLLFVVGLECNFKEVFTARNFFIAVAGVVAPFAGGYFLAAAFGYSSLEAMFVATALTATSIAITANVLKEMGKLNTETAKVIIGAAVIDDVLGLIVLSVTTGVSKSEFSFSSVFAKAGIALLFLLAVLFLMKYISRLIHLVDNWATKTGHFQVTIIAAMMIAFAYSAVAEIIGLSTIVGAFLAGVSLEPLAIRSYKEGAKYFEMLFSALFFVSIGVIVNLREIGAGWIFFIVLFFVAVLTKMAGCFIPAKLTGLKTRDSLIVGAGMVPRGEVAMIVALFGLTSGIIGQDLYGAILLMALATTMVVPFFIRTLYNHHIKKEIVF